MKSISEIASKLVDYDPDKVLWVCHRFHPESDVQKKDEMEKNAYTSELMGAQSIDDPEILRITAAFFRVLRRLDWELYLSMEIQVANMLHEMREPVDMADDKASRTLELRNKFPGEIGKLIKQMEELMDKIGGSDETSKILSRAAENEQVLGPEAMMKRLRKKEEKEEDV